MTQKTKSSLKIVGGLLVIFVSLPNLAKAIFIVLGAYLSGRVKMGT
jgi:hypothetical protein